MQSERCDPVRGYTETRRLHVIQSMIILSICLLADLACVPWITDQHNLRHCISLHLSTARQKLEAKGPSRTQNIGHARFEGV
jgi:hypothetical protein